MPRGEAHRTKHNHTPDGKAAAPNNPRSTKGACISPEALVLLGWILALDFASDVWLTAASP
jgi:hypothetical protein